MFFFAYIFPHISKKKVEYKTLDHRSQANKNFTNHVHINFFLSSFSFFSGGDGGRHTGGTKFPTAFRNTCQSTRTHPSLADRNAELFFSLFFLVACAFFEIKLEKTSPSPPFLLLHPFYLYIEKSYLNSHLILPFYFSHSFLLSDYLTRYNKVY